MEIVLERLPKKMGYRISVTSLMQCITPAEPCIADCSIITGYSSLIIALVTAKMECLRDEIAIDIERNALPFIHQQITANGSLQERETLHVRACSFREGRHPLVSPNKRVKKFANSAWSRGVFLPACLSPVAPGGRSAKQ